jgi:hypothetical protein
MQKQKIDPKKNLISILMASCPKSSQSFHKNNKIKALNKPDNDAGVYMHVFVTLL